MPSISKLPPKIAEAKKELRDNRLNRFTSLPVAIDILARRQLTLLSPETWEDRNDAYFLERYREELKYRSVLAFCFSTVAETFHHWSIFSGGPSGVCIEFNRPKLLSCIPKTKSFRHGLVEYPPAFMLKAKRPDIEKWPFLKRIPFEPEAEYRIIYENRKEAIRSLGVAIELAAIVKITLSPWLPESVAASVQNTLRAIDGCSNLVINKSTLLNNADWRALVE